VHLLDLVKTTRQNVAQFLLHGSCVNVDTCRGWHLAEAKNMLHIGLGDSVKDLSTLECLKRHFLEHLPYAASVMTDSK